MISKNTINISFKNMQYLLQDNVIENCFFMNQTIDKDLVDIDVYTTLNEYRNNPKKKEEFISKVRNECANNIWYYFREVVRIPDIFHLDNNIDTGLSMYPLTPNMCKLIYLYDKGLTPIVYDVSAKTITYLTFICIAIREEFFMNNVNNSAILDFISHDDISLEEAFKEVMHELVWGMNSVIGFIDALSPKHSSLEPWNFKIFDTNDKDIKYNTRNVYIAPCINNDIAIKKFLDESSNRNYSNCIGRIMLTHSIKSFELYDNYIVDSSFSSKNDYSVYDTDFSTIFPLKHFKV